MALSEKEIQQLKEQLEREAGNLEVQVKEDTKTPSFGDDVESDYSEEADEAEEFGNNAGIKDALKGRLGDIEQALDKIMHGTYGTCESCSEEISIELLKANPESRLCQPCKKERNH